DTWYFYKKNRIQDQRMVNRGVILTRLEYYSGITYGSCNILSKELEDLI
ncbi:MAG: hypothetical protein SCABRO_02607, partial [Candidatus Scalindua brodae]